MVQLMKSSESDRGKTTTASKENGTVKLEIDDGFSEEKLHRPLHKRSKTPSSLDQQWNVSAHASAAATSSQYNPLDEPSPLGLSLRKSPSLLDLIQMKLSQSSSADSELGNLGSEAKRNAAAASSMAEKLKASNFPASLLRIGKWEYKSRYEGDLVAKCYFAKHKLVWEVLEGGLKSKIEIQWSDIMALNANCPEEGPSSLNIVLSRQPLFFRETNPQPRKHTLWQATADFTDGQASLHRQHFLQCPPGLLIKHFEKLIQCDIRLNFLSRQPKPTLDSPLFDTRPGFVEQEESKSRSFDSTDKDSSFSGFEVSHNVLSSYLNKERDLVSASPESKLQEASSSTLGGGITSGLSGLKRSRDWDQIKVPGLHPSMSMSDLMNHIGNCLTDQIDPSSGTPTSKDVPGILEDIAEYLLSDSQTMAASDEKSLMARVNSLCCLLQKDPPQGQNQNPNQNLLEKPDPVIFECREDSRVSGNDGSSRTPALGMSRKDSFSDLLLQLPRITSLPKFLFDISEESENHSL